MGSIAKEGGGPRGAGPVGEIFADAKFPVAGRLAKGEEFSYSFERASMMMREEWDEMAKRSTLGPSICRLLPSRLHFLQSLLHHLRGCRPEREGPC